MYVIGTLLALRHIQRLFGAAVLIENMASENFFNKVALVIEDLVSTSPWVARGIKIHGNATIAEIDGRATLVIVPQRSWSWGVEEAAFKDGKPVSRKARR